MMPWRMVWLPLALVAGGCADMQWQKSGVSEAEQARELDACRREARSRSFELQNVRTALRPYATPLDPLGSATLVPPLSAEGDRAVIEQDLLRNCMRERGYELVPRRR